jgi:hypothetical protein
MGKKRMSTKMVVVHKNINGLDTPIKRDFQNGFKKKAKLYATYKRYSQIERQI